MKKHMLMPAYFRVFFPKKFKAITISKNTALYVDIETLNNKKVQEHEEVHMMQYEQHGWFNFIVLYLYYTLRYGYWNNPFEVEAREISGTA